MSSLYCLLAQLTFSYISISMITKAIQKSKTLIKENDGNNNFDGKEFEDALKSMVSKKTLYNLTDIIMIFSIGTSMGKES